MKQHLKAYGIHGLGLLVAAAQVLLLAVVHAAATVQAAPPVTGTVPALMAPERQPTTVWVGAPVAGLSVGRVDAGRVVLAGMPTRIELNLPAGARHEAVGLAVAHTALAALGAPYRWGATGRGGAFDCSGLIWRAFARHGVTVPRVSWEQARAGVPVRRSLNALEPGDLLTFSREPGGPVEHVGLYVGAGRFVHSSGGDGAVVVTPLAPGWWSRRWVGARRVVTSL